MPAGPGGLEPPLNLSYSSENVDEQHSWQGAAGWVGEGWNLSLGAVTWSEENVSSASTTGVDFRSMWQLADPYGTASQLIPPTQSVATYFDDTGHEYFDSDDSTTPYPNQPVQFHTADESQVRVYSYVNPDVNADLPDDGGGARPTCFRAYLPNGIMEEFGCTPTSVTSDAPGGVPDSLQYYYSSGAQKDYISGWFLDLITDPQGNQIHITYQHHNHHFTSGANEYVRDMVPATIEWDSPACHDATNYCGGAAWQPLMRVSFAASQSLTRTTNGPSRCNTSDIHLRRDDPKDLTSSGGLPAPEVVNTFALNDLDVQVRSSGSASWNTLADADADAVHGLRRLRRHVRGAATEHRERTRPDDQGGLHLVGRRRFRPLADVGHRRQRTDDLDRLRRTGPCDQHHAACGERPPDDRRHHLHRLLRRHGRPDAMPGGGHHPPP